MNLERNYKLKRVLLLSLCVLVLFGLAGCREKRSVSFENDISEEIIDNSTESQISAGELEKTEITDKSAMDDEREYMKLYFNDTEIPVIWEDNQTVQELMEEAGKGDIVVQMSMYSDNEQVGSLGKSDTKNDEQITTHSGDIVLYSGDKIAIQLMSCQVYSIWQNKLKKSPQISMQEREINEKYIDYFKLTKKKRKFTNLM